MDLFRRRLHTQHVAGPPLERPEDVVRSLVAVQSQDYPGAKWSVGQRVRRGTDAGVDRAFASGAILRTHVLRPTWHFVTPDDIGWLVRLTAPHVHALNAYYYRKLELDAALFARSHALFADALGGGRQRTRAELAALLRQAGIVADGFRLAYIMMHAELEGLVCSGALRGKQHTYALLAERAPAARVLARDEALAELALRFFTGHAPATLQHFVWWSALPVADARAGLAAVERQLTREVRDGHTFWRGAADPVTEDEGLTAYLLPEYDEALVGYADLAVPDLPRAGAWRDTFNRPVIVGGRRAGTWRRAVRKRDIVMEMNLFAPLDSAHASAVAAAVERYGRFLELPVVFA